MNDLFPGLEQVVEGLIFAAEAPMAAARIAEVYALVNGGEPPSSFQVDEMVTQLNEAYAAGGRCFKIYSWAGGYRMATTADVAPYLQAYHDHQRRRKLSRSLLETLAILAYRQPATKPEIDFVRGVDSDYALRKLMELDFVEVQGRSDSLGRPLLYRTTPFFLEQFGLERLEDLPKLREIEDLLSDPAFNREQARLLVLEGLDPTGDAEQVPASGVDHEKGESE